MSASTSAHDEAAQWWATAVSHIEPGSIELRDRPVQDLIGSVGLVDTLWLLLRGDLPSPRQSALLEAALVAGVDHGPQAPSIAAARMAATCGVGLNNAIATGVNMLGDVHGGAGQQCVEMLDEIRTLHTQGRDWDTAATEVMALYQARSRYLPGFGHRFHPVDPRRDPLLRLTEEAVAAGVVGGDYLQAALAVERALRQRRAGCPSGTDEHRRRHGRHLRRAGIPRTIGQGSVRHQPVGRHPGPRVGGDRAGPPEQGPHPPIRPARTPERCRSACRRGIRVVTLVRPLPRP